MVTLMQGGETYGEETGEALTTGNKYTQAWNLKISALAQSVHPVYTM